MTHIALPEHIHSTRSQAFAVHLAQAHQVCVLIVYLILADAYRRDRVDQVNERRLQLRIIERRPTDLVDGMKEVRKKTILRRNTEVVIHDLNEYMNSKKVRCLSGVRKDWQNPGVQYLLPFLSSYLTSVMTVC